MRLHCISMMRGITTMAYDKSTTKILKRLQEYETKTFPVIEKYDQNVGVKRVNGIGSFQEVYERLAAEVESGVKHMRNA